MKKKALVIVYVAVGVITCLITYSFLTTPSNVVNKGETEKLMLYRQYEEDVEPNLTWRSISNNSELLEYESNFNEWLKTKE